jgi:long-chain acyl-CoA synthetase
LRGAEICLPDLQRRGMAGHGRFRCQYRCYSAKWTAKRPDSLILVPELLKAWSLFLAAAGQRAPAALRYVAVGGARVSPALLSPARALGLPAYQGYGLTECGSVVSINRPGDDSNDVGRPLEHVGVRIVDGEVRVAARAFLGYVGEPTIADRRDARPARVCHRRPGRTSTPTGHLHLSGRCKNLLITSYGRNIAPEWVESVLLGAAGHRAGGGRRRRQALAERRARRRSPGADARRAG